jgi:uncharacterized protein
MLHDQSSQLMDLLLEALKNGKLCIVDISQLRGGPSLILSGLILRKIFDHNQDEFTKAESKTIPTIAVIEEAQSVLHDNATSSTPYIEWVKEGRKYDLGAVLITQQPGSIPNEILSQGDNWFIFHLLSAADLNNVSKANAHFSNDILSSLLNEPIPGQGVFWSGVSKMPFPISLRVLSFSEIYKTLDPGYEKGKIKTYASELSEKYQGDFVEGSNGQKSDPLRFYQNKAIQALSENEIFIKDMENTGLPWGVISGILKDLLPPSLLDRDSIAYNLVPTAMEKIFGPRDISWTTEKRGAKQTLFIVKIKN